MTPIRITLTTALMTTLIGAGIAHGQTTTAQGTTSRAATAAAPSVGTIAPRTPGGTSVGAVQGDQGRMSNTVSGIDRHLLNQEKDRPTLPNQTPSPSQTLPGGTASGQSPR